GRDSLPDLFALRHADNEGSGTRARTTPRLEELKERVDRVIQEDDALDLSALEITGTDLMESLSLSPGPEVGKLLKHLLDVVLENPERNSREVLLEIAREKHKSA
ncbi:MAG: poly(A) polymerase, partial [Candidatus Eisenbacteria bacterium]|nr:poly(A) polymerase [Candidatus Eisenbacteria bacterium]